jgi:hypothetical protein
MSLIIKKNTTFKIPRTPFLPSSLGGLALWLKADSGVSTFRLTYASQIILTGAYDTDFNGTYTAISEPDGNGDYSLVGPVYTMSYAKAPNEYVLAFNSLYSAGSFISYDGVNWSILNSILNPAPYVSGITGTYSDANGQYGYGLDDPREPEYKRADYTIAGAPGSWTLTYHDNENNFFLLATNSNTIPNGTWTNVDATGTIVSSTALYPDPNQSIPTGSVTTSEYGNSFVTSWADQSGNGKNMTPSNGNEPTFIVSELNGKPVLDFDGGKYLTSSFSEIVISQQSVFIVFKFVSNKLSTFARAFSQNNNAYNDYQTPGNIIPLLRREGTNNMSCYGSSDAWLASIPVSDNTWYISTTISDGTNGAFSLNASNTQNFTSTLNATISNMRVGACIFSDGSVPDLFNSKLAEVIVYNRNLTTPERQQVEAYLNQKYVIY